jgi:uncharacterized protein Usg
MVTPPFIWAVFSLSSFNSDMAARTSQYIAALQIIRKYLSVRGGRLDFWCREIEGPLHSVRVASSALTRPAELRYANGQFTLH